jgi:hypothetical protein
MIGTARRTKNARRHIATCAAALLLLGITAAGWLALKAAVISDSLTAVNQLVPKLKRDVLNGDATAASATIDALTTHTTSAREATDDPVWAAAGMLPWAGANFQAASEAARSADDVVRLGAAPLIGILESLDWKSLLPSVDGIDLAPLAAAQPRIAGAAFAVSQSSDRLNGIATDELVPQLAGPLIKAREQLGSLRGGLNAAANAAEIAPDMLGANSTRQYLLLIQNNSESRATGGIPGALAVLTMDKGRLSLGDQTSAAALGVMTPTLPVDFEQQQIYSTRIGKFMQDVNLTPDFPTAASTAQAMWERKTGQRLDGVISLDPVALSYVLSAMGPVHMTDKELLALTDTALPTQLTGKNVVKTLLSDVYGKIDRPELQDAYFAGVAQETFSALSTGKGDAAALIEGITRGASDGRILVWSREASEQAVIAQYPISGSITGPALSPAGFGVYFNDGTGAKMDYHVKRTVQLVQECTGDDYGQVKVRITSTNTAPADAATSLPAYVTGGGVFGVPPGTVQTNVIAYGPVQANVETAHVDGKKVSFAANRHANRPVGTVTVTLAPGQSSTVEMTFGKIVQHTEPNLVVTPTVQPVNEVVLATEPAVCVPEE